MKEHSTSFASLGRFLLNMSNGRAGTAILNNRVCYILWGVGGGEPAREGSQECHTKFNHLFIILGCCCYCSFQLKCIIILCGPIRIQL